MDEEELIMKFIANLGCKLRLQGHNAYDVVQ